MFNDGLVAATWVGAAVVAAGAVVALAVPPKPRAVESHEVALDAA